MIRLDTKFRSGVLTGALIAFLGFSSFGIPGLAGDGSADAAADVVAFSCDFGATATPVMSALPAANVPTLAGLSGPVEILNPGDDASVAKVEKVGDCRLLRAGGQVAALD